MPNRNKTNQHTFLVECRGKIKRTNTVEMPPEATWLWIYSKSEAYFYCNLPQSSEGLNRKHFLKTHKGYNQILGAGDKVALVSVQTGTKATNSLRALLQDDKWKCSHPEKLQDFKENAQVEETKVRIDWENHQSGKMPEKQVSPLSIR